MFFVSDFKEVVFKENRSAKDVIVYLIHGLILYMRIQHLLKIKEKNRAYKASDLVNEW